MKLFAFYVGGDTETSNIELHDLFFSVGEKPEDCYEDLKKQWWGTPQSLHIDCFGDLHHANGYDIILKSEPYSEDQQLYFANLGGYDTTLFTELHKNLFVVAPTESKAKVKALKTVPEWSLHHKDNLYEVENMLCLNDLLKEKDIHIHLIESKEEKPFEFTCGYFPIGKENGQFVTAKPNKTE